MIRITQRPEPAGFNQSVRVPGKLFLQSLKRTPTKREWDTAKFWRNALPDLQNAYADVCAYTCCWLSDSASVDHYEPKSKRPDLAFEWSNYRLASQKVNSRKGDSRVLDPFKIGDTWFALNFASQRVHPSSVESTQLQAQVQHTIATLGLNDASWIRVRFSVIKQYSQGKVGFEYLQECYPFIARELDRQGLKTSILGMIP